MNNKGMTLVELIITFSLLLIIVVGLYNLILEVKFQIDNKQIAKDITEYSALINNDIHYKLLKNEPFVILTKEKSSSTWICNKRLSTTGSCSVSSSSVTTSHPKADGTNVTETKTFDALNKICKDIYPCGIYYSFNNNALSSYVIALNKDNETNQNNLTEKGILYGNSSGPLFEPVPDNEYIEIRDMNLINAETGVTTRERDKPYITVRNNVLVINYALYIVDDDHNYGFKIAYPFS